MGQHRVWQGRKLDAPRDARPTSSLEQLRSENSAVLGVRLLLKGGCFFAGRSPKTPPPVAWAVAHQGGRVSAF
jgi:hypothetical protein